MRFREAWRIFLKLMLLRLKRQYSLVFASYLDSAYTTLTGMMSLHLSARLHGDNKTVQVLPLLWSGWGWGESGDPIKPRLGEAGRESWAHSSVVLYQASTQTLKIWIQGVGRGRKLGDRRRTHAVLILYFLLVLYSLTHQAFMWGCISHRNQNCTLAWPLSWM